MAAVLLTARATLELNTNTPYLLRYKQSRRDSTNTTPLLNQTAYKSRRELGQGKILFTALVLLELNATAKLK
jgi:hypothetical protein